ncbi:MAG: sulfotransferase [Rhizobiales bacterium]|nr:sulfotransferase [Hyphomicrobiales bacterium]MBI3672215.1 sulfotransferase [Hyphomicrobiales bacterium]
MTGPLPSWTEAAVLVYGPRKAGTTLFQNLLDGSEEMLVYPAELKLKYFAKPHNPGEGLGEAWRGLSRIGQIKSPHFSVETYERLWREGDPGNDLASLVRRDARAVLESCSRKPSKLRLWCAKEVGSDTDAILALWRKLFPHGRILFILRDPRLVSRAILNDRRRKKRPLSLYQIAREAWDSLRVVRAQARHLADSGLFAIAYEDLVADPAGTMQRVAGFLGVEPWPTMATPTLFGEAIVVRTASRAETAVFADNADWRDGLTTREKCVVSAAFTAARLLGLAPDYDTIRRKLKAPAPSAGRNRD